MQNVPNSEPNRTEIDQEPQITAGTGTEHEPNRAYIANTRNRNRTEPNRNHTAKTFPRVSSDSSNYLHTHISICKSITYIYIYNITVIWVNACKCRFSKKSKDTHTTRICKVGPMLRACPWVGARPEMTQAIAHCLSSSWRNYKLMEIMESLGQIPAWHSGLLIFDNSGGFPS